MSKCYFYREEINVLTSREIRSDRQPAEIVKTCTPWCAHKHSLVKKKFVMNVLCGADLLVCGGSLQKCMIAVEKLADI